MNGRLKKDELIREYVRALTNGNAALFAGAGLSIPSGGLSWAKLLEKEAKNIGIDVHKEHDLTSVAQYIYNESGSRQVITDLLKNHINEYGKVNENHKILSALPINKIWTTNYDDYIEKSLMEANKAYDVKKSVDDMTSESDDAETTIYKMHGDIGNLNNTVILKDDYELYDTKNEVFLNALQNDLINHTFLFFGFSFDDPNLQNILSKVRIMIGDSGRRHYCILKKVSIDDQEFINLESNEKEEAFKNRKNMQRLRVNDLKRYNINAVLVDDYKEMTDILTHIKYSFLSNTVFVSGAYDKVESFLGFENDEATRVAGEFTKKLGFRLCQENYKVKSGFGLGVGRNIVQGFLDAEAYAGRSKLSKDLTIHPFPAGYSQEQNHTYREKIMVDAGICIIVFGNKTDPVNGDIIKSNGILDEYSVAKEYGQFIIPIGLTGYLAKDLWKSVQRYDRLPKMNELINQLNDESIFNGLDENDDTGKINLLLDLIFEILELYKTNLDKIYDNLAASSK
ncbi:SIR2 family protein [Fundicoccus culcitae]|uniref:SIR2 family protein n=1 Tax=Fundicoccus culcitae TaxID=2969821 RepID=A0ABY5P8Y2_9LACT|nr:SIR2 family protein [Fundicoccus culcitae]UUX35207.1 SIR2 family protein [Fundicoccus culcitae]